ncbi:MAG: metallophosphoesterase family protein [Planctomycetaceae bacterium]|nr:metallophosphoesterase family protein [Planctomycetaceae bacterium]
MAITQQEAIRVRWAIFGDIHSNLEALDAVMAECQKLNVERYLCLGDIVGYGADPVKCLERVIDMKIPIVAGNHDWAVCGKLSIEFFNTYAKHAVYWTREQLTETHMEALRTWELVIEVNNDITLVHGSLSFPDLFDYIQTSQDARLSLDKLRTRVCFLGHSHVPVTFFSGPMVSYTMSYEIDLKGFDKSLVNVGSVGQPRDENPKASFGLYDDKDGKVYIKRVEYDVDKAGRKIIDAGLPEILAERLKYGR